jgi:serine/threonine-protein kinase
VTEGDTVDLVINRKSGRKGHGNLVGLPGGSFFRYRVNDGLLKRHIRVVLNIFGASNTIFDEFVQPGEEIRLIIPNNDNTTLFLYEDDKLIKTQVFDEG